MQAVDTSGAQLTSGGGIVYLRVENLEGGENDGVQGLPWLTPMTDNGDGTYTGDYSTISSSSGTVAVSAYVHGLKAEYWDFDLNIYPEAAATYT